MRLKIFALSWFVAVFISAAFGHEGHHDDASPPAGTIKGGKLTGVDGISYLDAGATLQLGPIKLDQKVSANNQIVYSSNYENPILPVAIKGGQILSLSLPGGETLKPFSAKSAAKIPPTFDFTSISSARNVEISRTKGLTIEWKRVKNEENYSIQVIIETLRSGTVTGRVVAETKDDGLYFIPGSSISQLPLGAARLAVKRIGAGGFMRNQDSMVGVKSVLTKIFKADVVD
jgi:hypothetical protein